MSADNIRAVCQFMLANGCVPYDTFVNFLQGLRADNASQMTEERVLEAVSNLNKRLAKFNMMIRSTCDDVTYQKFYSLISTVDTEITKLASHHTEKELEFFRIIWQELTQEGPTQRTELYRLGENLKLINEKQLMDDWCKKHWLVEDNETIRLGPRAKAELDVLVQTQPSSSFQQT